MFSFPQLKKKKNPKKTPKKQTKTKTHQNLLGMDYCLVERKQKSQKILCITRSKMMTSRVDRMDLAHRDPMG